MFGKKKKSYGSIMSAFSKVVTDLKDVVEKEETNVVKLTEKRKIIDYDINTSEKEINNCNTAIENVQNMFPDV